MNDEHEHLLYEWQESPDHRGKCFIQDGIVDPTSWSKAGRKVLFVLREAYDSRPNSTGFDLRRKIRDEWKELKQKPTWRNVANWAYAAHYTERDSIPELTDQSRPLRARALLASAVINVKKSGGKKISDAIELAEYVRTDGDRLRRQIELVNPDLVICGGTWGLIRRFWAGHDERVYGDKKPAVFRVGRRYFVHTWHPANRFPERLNYYAMASVIRVASVASLTDGPVTKGAWD